LCPNYCEDSYFYSSTNLDCIGCDKYFALKLTERPFIVGNFEDLIFAFILINDLNGKHNKDASIV